jgi:hypothetical protein
LGLIGISVFIHVTAFYRNDALPQAAFLLSITTALSYSGGFLAILLVKGASPGFGALLLMGSLLGLPIRILVFTIVFAIIVAVGRRFRRFLAPQTTNAAGGPDEKSAA